MDTPSSILIEATYDNECHSFDVPVKGMKLDLNFAKLMEKIRSLFNFGSDVTFRLFYVDEENDNCVLVSDYDLDDVMCQRLNPLIITVKLINPIVFKVKYGDECRSFDVPLKDEKLGLNFDKLMEKIRSLFNFGSDVTFRLIYVDEKKLNVVLFRDDDLDDIMRQQLDPVIITVERL